LVTPDATRISPDAWSTVNGLAPPPDPAASPTVSVTCWLSGSVVVAVATTVPAAEFSGRLADDGDRLSVGAVLNSVDSTSTVPVALRPSRSVTVTFTYSFVPATKSSFFPDATDSCPVVELIANLLASSTPVTIAHVCTSFEFVFSRSSSRSSADSAWPMSPSVCSLCYRFSGASSFGASFTSSTFT